MVNPKVCVYWHKASSVSYRSCLVLLLLLMVFVVVVCVLWCRWYHGKLDRTIAEERLRQARTPGSYLIRESDRRPGSFVLSFLSVTNVVNHFR